MKVLIVAKTRMGGGACVGAITVEEGRSVRLLDAHVDAHNGGGMHYAVGEVWEIDDRSRRKLCRRTRKTSLCRAAAAPVAGLMWRPFVEQHMPPAAGRR